MLLEHPETYEPKTHYGATPNIQGIGTHPQTPIQVLNYFKRAVGDRSYEPGHEAIKEALQQFGRKYPISENYLNSLPVITKSTSEHAVYLDSSHRRAVKVLKPGKFGMTVKNPEVGIVDATLQEYIERLVLTNHIFQSDITVEGITLINDSLFDEEAGTPSLVTSQEWIVQDMTPKDPQKEIEKFLKEFKFNPGSRTHQWKRSDGVYIADAKNENFVFTVDGPRPVDLLISFIE